MRTTIDVNDHLFAEAKERAAKQGVSLRRLFEQALRAYLEPNRKRKGYKFCWRTEHGRIQPGVQLEDRDALFDLMDGR